MQTMSSLLGNEPHNPKATEIIGKLIIGTILGLFISAFIFAILLVTAGVISNVIETSRGGSGAINAMYPLILLFITLIASFVGNISLVMIYNMLFGGKYYDFGKMIKLIVISNSIFMLIMAILYIIFAGDPQGLFIIVAFHLLFSVFISLSLIDFLSNPNYSGVYLIGNGIGFIFCIFVFSIFFKSSNNLDHSSFRLLLTLPAILGYSLIPLASSLWEKMYYNFYSNGNNFLYLPSIEEVEVDEEEVDDSNVDF